ncbi:small RNA 2'-O-methyltransferase-like [Punica granatum]|uniref:Small RNA 2'-O-methyltransferase-like n=2 Tax=Punica granatum TaxID=22663 RepID=A0A6P8CPH0_PUNGR|nr:small RNA 2'-O-methyltransferase-like [Punica granatum]XP_031384194.1 small RNA 2'-O-methyltransferase-like [Punica granatum]OWM71305.1 hypothetical protein CDL15_Pgr011433 [Punica granatum]PKI59042.1 hypothetical protein CRG98_020610 [Punica granatum]
MEGEGAAADPRKHTITPKAVIHTKFGSKATYVVEEVIEQPQNGCPGLSIPQKGPCLYQCRLELPELSVVSGQFRKKKDAEHDAAQKALHKLGIHQSKDNPTLEEAWEELVSRIGYLFSDEFLASQHPMSGHLRATLRREGDLCGLVPITVIAACDGKVNSLCKSIDPKVDSNACLALLFIKSAASKLSGSLSTSDGGLWIKRQNPYPQNILDSSTMQESCSSCAIRVHALYIPSSREELVEPLSFDVPPSGYYLDIIAQKLGLSSSSEVLISRSIGRASSETRLYYAASEFYQLDASSTVQKVEPCRGSLNVRASFLSGQDIFGDAILAAVGYAWKSKELFVEDISLQSYFRMLMNKTPAGAYKLSRGAIITAELPAAFTTKTNWRGLLPRELLCTFCRQHRLAEPKFTTSIVPVKSAPDLSGPPKKLRIMKSDEETEYADVGRPTPAVEESPESGSTFKCEVKILSKTQEVILVCSPKESFKRQIDCIQTAALKVLLWFNAYFLDTTPETLTLSADSLDITFNTEHFRREFKLSPSVYKYQQKKIPEIAGNNCHVIIEGPDSGMSPSSGSLASISYSVLLATVGGHVKELLESANEFEFEIGTGSVVSHVEVAVAQMSVGQSAFFSVDIPDQELILAASDDPTRTISLLDSNSCCLEYCVTLLHITEPLEDRMEQALFSPPLSKQRVEYAVCHIRESDATSLVDFGCGSGSLLDSLLDYATGLEKIVGVDISVKSLIRAAKVLHSKLSKNPGSIKSSALYDGSITVFDSRLCDFDIGTCLEVIEHMEEEQAHLFGDVVLSSFRPKTLIVSTPNYEYNVILQGSAVSSQEEDAEEKSQQERSYKFRNHDHKFEWTRKQFESWASKLAVKHNYRVEFSGVGGSGDVDPGFASQIAVFRREALQLPSLGDGPVATAGPASHHCNIVWEWNNGSGLP